MTNPIRRLGKWGIGDAQTTKVQEPCLIHEPTERQSWGEERRGRRDRRQHGLAWTETPDHKCQLGPTDCQPLLQSSNSRRWIEIQKVARVRTWPPPLARANAVLLRVILGALGCGAATPSAQPLSYRASRRVTGGEREGTPSERDTTNETTERMKTRSELGLRAVKTA